MEIKDLQKMTIEELKTEREKLQTELNKPFDQKDRSKMDPKDYQLNLGTEPERPLVQNIGKLTEDIKKIDEIIVEKTKR